MPDFHRSAWAYPWSHPKIPHVAIFDPGIDRRAVMQPCPHTSRNNQTLTFRPCQGVRQGIAQASHGPPLVCSLCAERNWYDMHWAIWYPFRIISDCYDCSKDLHSTNAANPDDDPTSFCMCTGGVPTPDFNTQYAARGEWLCHNCAGIYGDNPELYQFGCSVSLDAPSEAAMDK